MLKKTAAVLLLAVIAATALFSACGDEKPADTGNAPQTAPAADKETETAAGTGAEDIRTGDPDPRGLSGFENFLRIKDRLANEKNYSADGYSTVSTKVLFFTYTQEIWTCKDFSDGVMIQADIAKSTFVNSAWQTCFFAGNAYMRGPESSSSGRWDGRNTEWETEPPESYSYEEYTGKYGLLGTEISVYELNADTVICTGEVTKNEDGTYSVTLYPDVEKSALYYKKRMTTMGDLSKEPEFKSISITYVFDSGWRLLRSHTEENYSVKMGIISSDDCSAVTDFTYTYGTADISDYYGYFASYAK